MKTYGENSIELLNSRIDDFYSYNLEFIKQNKVVEFKAIFITLINQLERVFNGVFGKPFRMDDEEDFRLFEELFPVVYKAASCNIGKEGVQKLCRILSSFRNLNAHALTECDYAAEFDVRYILEKLPNYSDEVKYFDDDGMPTLAGMITLLLFLSNDKAVSYFVKHNIWNGFLNKLNYFGKSYEAIIKDFPTKMMEINQINDEIDIRKPVKSSSLIEAVFGRFSNKVEENCSEYCYQNGEDDEDSSFHVSFSVKENNDGSYTIQIKKKSNYISFFQSNYTLTIFDVDSFIEWCEKVPPFMLILYLYKGKYSEYRSNLLNDKKQQEALLKLNKPKHYVDKNVDTLFLGDKLSDIRMGGQVISVGINYCLYMFELVVFKRKEMGYLTYSQLRHAMEKIGLSDSVINKIVAIRNFFSHYYIIGDAHAVGVGSAKIDLTFIINAFAEMIDELEAIDSFKARSVSDDFYYRVICNLLLFKYSDVCKKSMWLIKNPDENNLDAYNKTMGRIQNSFFTDDDEELIKKEFGNVQFNMFGNDLKHLYKCTIQSNNQIIFKNGFECEMLSLIAVNMLTPAYFLKNKSCIHVGTRIKGFIQEDIWNVN